MPIPKGTQASPRLATQHCRPHERIARWRFRSSGVPIWLGCRYEGTGIVLTRQLSASYKENAGLSTAPVEIVKQISCD
ncbi:STY0301 family protein [Paraburkholderia sp. UCT70]|uniref:STY0301 family protein n=1 Tax=Paraburkholderia sp. UCT70 TaxID=2991068 RepID=UPI003D1AA436